MYRAMSPFCRWWRRIESCRTRLRVVPLPSNPRLAREVASLDRARGFALKGEAVAALSELNDFTQKFGYSALPLEAQFVRIDALVALGRRAEAARLAQSLPWENLSTAQRRRLRGIVWSR